MLRIPIHSAFLYLTSVTCLIGAFHPSSAGAEVPRATTRASVAAPVPGEVTDVDLATLWEASADHLGHTVRFSVQFHSIREDWNPYLTRFGTEDFVQVRFWSDSQVLWVPEQFDRPYGIAFVRRSEPWLMALRDSRPYQRYELVAEVRQVFLDRPWMEIRSIKPLAGSMTEGALVHAGRGVALYRSENWKLARSEFERARSVALDARMHAHLDQLIEVCGRLGGSDDDEAP